MFGWTSSFSLNRDSMLNTEQKEGTLSVLGSISCSAVMEVYEKFEKHSYRV